MPLGYSKKKHPEMYQTSSPLPVGPELVRKARELARKDEDLAKWEEDLVIRQTAMDDTTTVNIGLKVIEAKIQSKKDELAKVEHQLSTRKAAVEQELARLDKQAANSRDLTAEARTESQQVLDEVKARGAEEAQAVSRLRDIELEIKHRKEYLAEQEDLIDTSMGEGNQRLNSVNREIKLCENEREELLTKIHEGQAGLLAIEQKTETKGEDLERLNSRYEGAAREYRANLAEVKTEISQAEIDRDKINAEADQKLLDLKAERAELEIAREVMAKQRADIVGEKRQLNSQRSIYGIE